MFEKEAEEYANENLEHYEEGQNDYKALKQAFQDGAEFGYNKANEWHDLKTERPQLRKEVLWLIDNQLWLGELLESRIDFDEWELDSVLFNDYEIRWKEIVLPELKENE